MDHVDHIEIYKNLEESLASFSRALEFNENENLDLQGKQKLWQSIFQGQCTQGLEPFVPQNRDVIKQLMVGFGMRVTGSHSGCGTKSFLVTSLDPCGVQLVVTAKDSCDEMSDAAYRGQDLHHFRKGTSYNCCDLTVFTFQFATI